MTNAVLADRIFDHRQQVEFGRLSGDMNPLHIDPIDARRSVAGGQTVHGIHLLLWAIDAWSHRREEPFAIARIDVLFLRPALVGEHLEAHVVDDTPDGAQLEVCSGAGPAAVIGLATRDSTVSDLALNVTDDDPELIAPQNLGADEIAGRIGELPLVVPRPLMQQMFPSLSRWMPTGQLATLLASTRMVGGECPGLHSLYSELHLAVTSDTQAEFSYKVSKLDRRFGSVVLDVSGATLRGSVVAFIRPLPHTQAPSSVVRQFVDNAEFSSQRALVVGGSRGLGEVTAKILASGGADVRLTFHRGRTDAERVVADIASDGGHAELFAWDVTADSESTPVAAEVAAWKPTHLYYMATPHIAPGGRGTFLTERFRDFAAYYVSGFAATVRSFRTPELAGVFFPSSVFVDDMPPGMDEYVAAKSAGEAICSMIRLRSDGVHVAAPRLPRLATDQTSGIGPSARLDALPVLLDEIRRLASTTV